jgi:hypothetical protein
LEASGRFDKSLGADTAAQRWTFCPDAVVTAHFCSNLFFAGAAANVNNTAESEINVI